MFNKQQLQHLKINEGLKLYLLMLNAGKSIAEITNHKQSVKNTIFLAYVSNKQNTKMDNPALSGGQGKYMKYVTLPWPCLR
jgi:hypothetical protein